MSNDSRMIRIFFTVFTDYTKNSGLFNTFLLFYYLPGSRGLYLGFSAITVENSLRVASGAGNVWL
jgi:hypothetical protein